MRKLFGNIFPLSIIYLAVLAIFSNGLSNYFLQDDFYNIYRGFVGSFVPIPYFAFRPIPYEIFGWIVVNLLGTNPVLTHAILFVFHFLNIYLLWKLIGKFTKNKKIQFFASFLYGTSSTHFGVLFWVTANYVLFGTTLLLIFLLTLFSSKTNLSKGKIFSFLFLYFLMLLTNEVFSILPLFLVILSVYRKNIKQIIFPAALLSGLSIFFRVATRSYSVGKDYEIGSIGEIIKTIWWYVLRGFNLAEGVKLMDKTDKLLVFLCAVFLALIFCIVFFIFAKTRKKPDGKILILGLSGFLFFTAPFFALSHHLSSYYLNTALLGFTIMITYFWLPIFQKKGKIYQALPFIFLIFFAYLSFVNIRFAQKESWITRRGEIARRYVSLTKKLYLTLPKGATLVFGKTAVDHNEISISLYNEYAFKLIYKDPTLKVIYDQTHILMPNEYGISEGDS